ncbi:MAG: tripartite tricarboxylate transporter permease [Candidatus Adiutrix sp.]|nr:tripartite tricarboxylate transporter permease [Candidatus Adiutrix sp.]
MTPDSAWFAYNLTLLPVMFSATMLGVVIGALPGLTTTMGVALVVGFTGAMSLDNGLAVLLGVFVGGVYGGSLSAILLNIPGTPSAAATAIDGHILARQGLADTAIKVTRLASVVGTGLSCLALYFLTPVLAAFSLSFQSPEFFMLAFFGVSICGSITSEDLALKGWIGGLFGVLISLVGMDDLEGAPRFTFGLVDLMSGISIIPVMIGLYAFPAVVNGLAEAKRAVATRIVPHVATKSAGVFAIVARRLDTVLKSAGVGIGIGILPGVGEDVAAWLAYDLAKKTSREKEKFGQGCYDAVIAPETANNAGCGGALIPMLLLGVPGSPPVAILLAALIMHGVRPGPMLLVESPNFVAQMAFMLFLATVCLWAVASLIARPITKILNVPAGVLLPIVAALSFIGAYAINLSRFDLWLALFFGALGWLLQKMKYSPAPIALGMILGKLLDSRFRTTLMISDGSFWPFLSRPISFVFLCVTLCLLWRQYRSRSSKTPG